MGGLNFTAKLILLKLLGNILAKDLFERNALMFLPIYIFKGRKKKTITLDLLPILIFSNITELSL